SAKDITKDYGKISQDVIFKGMGELRRRKLIEVMYDDLTDKDYTKRSPKLYKLLELYSPEKLDLDLAKLSEQYGEKEYKQARKYANIVFEEYNPQIIEDIILKTKQYGPKKIKEAFAIVAKKNIDNPKRKYSYVVGILENWGTGANKQKIDFGTMVQVLAYTEIDEMKRAFDKWSDRETVNKLSKITITDDHIKELYKEFQEVLVTPPNPETYTEYSIDNGEEALEKAEQLGSKMQNLFLALSKKDFVKYGKLVGIMKEVLYIDVRHVPLAIKHDNSRNIYWYELHYKGVEMAGEEYERLFKVQL
ncbi:MAG: hypothetical protein KJ915_03215, partial [Candidatus Omnitrophica bacterium]|nr:hypothetical protein [Candidatus Omnitrophota bacterium]